LVVKTVSGNELISGFIENSDGQADQACTFFTQSKSPLTQA